MSKRLVVIEEDRLLEMLVEAVKIATGGNLTGVPYVSLEKEEKEYLTRDEAAEKLRITPTTLSKWVEEGKIKNIGRGRKHLYKMSDIKKHM